MRNAFDETGYGCNFIGVGDTGEALRRLNTDVLPDLILLTLDPDAAGLQFVRTLKAEQDWRTIRVVAFSGGTGPQEAEAVYASGVSAYMTKPLDFDGHIRLASELLALDYKRTQNAGGTGMLLLP